MAPGGAGNGEIGEMSNKEYSIAIHSWDKYNPKRDQKTYTWLRLSNDIATDPDLYGLSAAQKFVWIVILCEASRKNNKDLTLSVNYLEHATGVNESDIDALFLFLERKQIITIQCRDHDNVLPPSRHQTTPDTTPTYVRTNERTDGDLAIALDAKVLQEIWNEHSSPSQPKCRTLNASRRESANRRLRENSDREYWVRIVKAIAASDWHNGKNDRKWVADFDYFLRPNTHVRFDEKINLSLVGQSVDKNNQQEILAASERKHQEKIRVQEELREAARQ